MKTIGMVAKELGITVETIRFYEREGLMEQPIKPQVGYRRYDDAFINQLKFILKAKTLGFTLSEIQSLLRLSHSCQEVASIGQAKLALVQQKISDLQRLERVITSLINHCHTNKDPTNCPIIESLNKA